MWLLWSTLYESIENAIAVLDIENVLSSLIKVLPETTSAENGPVPTVVLAATSSILSLVLITGR